MIFKMRGIEPKAFVHQSVAESNITAKSIVTLYKYEHASSPMKAHVLFEIVFDH